MDVQTQKPAVSLPPEPRLRVQGSIFSAVLAELLDAVSWGQPKALRDSPANSPGASPRRGPLATPSGPAASPAASRSASGALPKVAVQRSNLATAALAAHPFRPLYLSGAGSSLHGGALGPALAPHHGPVVRACLPGAQQRT